MKISVPVLTGEYANLSAQDTTRERQAAQLRVNNLNNADPNAMDVSDDDPDCSMIIFDGVMMGPLVIKLTWSSRDWMLTFFLALCSRRMY